MIVHTDTDGKHYLENGAPIESHKDWPLHIWKGTRRADGSAIDYVCEVPGCEEKYTEVRF